MNVSVAISWLDSPSSTSALTYAIYWKMLGAGAGTVWLNNYIQANGQTVCSMTLMEIAA